MTRPMPGILAIIGLVIAIFLGWVRYLLALGLRFAASRFSGNGVVVAQPVASRGNAGASRYTRTGRRPLGRPNAHPQSQSAAPSLA